MKLMKDISTILLIFCYSLGIGQSGNNIISGKIKLPKVTTSVLQKGAHYKEFESLSELEKQHIKSFNAPHKNVYISMHPQDFQPTLTVRDAQITQRFKTFLPNVVAVTKGSTVHFLNEDEEYHNVFSLTSRSRFNIGRRPPGNVYPQKINKVGQITLNCDIHAHMAAVILSFDTPYFTKINEDGTFRIGQLPDGNYELRVFHPAYRSFQQQVMLNGGKEVSVVIDLLEKP